MPRWSRAPRIAGVATRPLSLYHLRRRGAAKGLLLGYGAVREEDIATRFGVLAEAVNEFL